jgi:internalin A
MKDSPCNVQRAYSVRPAITIGAGSVLKYLPGFFPPSTPPQKRMLSICRHSADFFRLSRGRYLAPVAAIILAACGGSECVSGPLCDGDGGGTGVAVPTSIGLSAATLSFDRLAATQQITAAVRDQNQSPIAGLTLTWASADEAVVTVDQLGAVTAVGNGAANVTVTSGAISQDIAVTVRQVPSTVDISPDPVFLGGIGNTVSLELTVQDGGGTSIVTPSTVWTSADEAIVTVDQSGDVTAVSLGSTVVSVDVSFQGGASVSAWVAVSVAAPITLLPSQLCSDFKPSDYVTFGESALAQAVGAALGLAPSDPISCAQAASLQTLNAIGIGLISLTGIQNLTGLLTAGLQSNQIVDLGPLATLAQLETLFLDDNEITDVTPLSGLTGLGNLGISQNQVADVSALSPLTGLRDLDVGFNPVSDISFVSNFLELTGLSVPATNVSSLAPLAGRAIDNLDISYSDITDLSLIATFTDLRILGAADVGVTDADITGFASLAQLTDLDVRDNLGIANLTPLTAMTQLVSLFVGYTSVADITPLQGLTNLQRVHLNGTLVDDISALLNNSGLGSGDFVDLSDTAVTCADAAALAAKGVSVTQTCSAEFLLASEFCSDYSDFDLGTFTDAALEGAVRSALGIGGGDDLTCGLLGSLESLSTTLLGITNLTGAQNLTGATSLYFNRNSISDVAPVSTLAGLTTLELGANNISDVSMLNGLTGLTTLNLGSNGFISDISALSGMTQMATLYLDNNQIASITALSGMNQLSALYLNANDVVSLAPIAGQTSLTFLQAEDNLIDDLSALTGMSSLGVLFLSSNPLTDGDLSALTGLTQLSHLYLQNMGLTDISAISTIPFLSALYIDRNSLTDLDALAGMIALATVHAWENLLTDISGLATLPSQFDSTVDLHSNPGLIDVSALLNHTGFMSGDMLDVTGTLVSCSDVGDLELKGVTVISGC